MAWNIPGKNNDGDGNRPDRGNGGERRRNPWKPRGSGGGPFDGLIDALRNMFGGGGGGPLRWIGVLLALWLVFNCFVLVGEQERGVVLRFGQFARIMQPGPNFKLPWPLERVTKINTTGVRTFSNSVPVLTRDENIITVSFNVQYLVSDPRQFMFGTRDAERVLQQVAQSVVREQFGRADVDAALNNRGPLSSAAKTSLQVSLNAYRTGTIVTDLQLQDARPPEEVKPAFDEVNSAEQVNDRLVNEARAYASKIVPEARGEAARTRTIAQGYKTAAIARATGDAERFTLLLEQYANAPDVTRKRLWLDTVQQVLADNRKVIGGDGRQLIYVPMTAGQGGTASPPPVLSQELMSPTVSATPEAPREEVRLPRPTRDGEPR
jgi:membrane protease subunit HflK